MHAYFNITNQVFKAVMEQHFSNCIVKSFLSILIKILISGRTDLQQFYVSTVQARQRLGNPPVQ